VPFGVGSDFTCRSDGYLSPYRRLAVPESSGADRIAKRKRGARCAAFIQSKENSD
jgi:hypothetical protein